MNFFSVGTKRWWTETSSSLHFPNAMEPSLRRARLGAPTRPSCKDRYLILHQLNGVDSDQT